MLPTEHNAGRPSTLGQTYAELTVQWVRQTRAYARSLRAYQHCARMQGGRPASRPAQAALRSRFDGMDAVPTNGEQEPGQDAATVEPETSAAPVPPITAPLTGRQFEVAQLIARGMSNEEIARRLVLTPGTVGNHVGHILRRLGARNRAQVATWVTRVGTREGGGGSLAS